MRSTWAALIKLIIHESGHWVEIGDGFYTPLVTSLAPSRDEAIDFKIYGLILRLSLLWGLEFLPISPALILFLLRGYDAATAPAFIDSVAPEISKRLATWPPQSTISEDGQARLDLKAGLDPMNLIIDVEGNVQV